MTEAVGRAVSIETETINRNMDSIMEKLTALQKKNWWYSRSEWTKRVAVELECGYSPKQSQSYLFWLPRTSTGPARSLLEIYPWERTLQWDALASPPPFYRHWYKLLHTHTHMHSLSLPPSLAFVALNPPAWRAGLWTAPRMAAGPDGCLLELDHFPCCKVCLWFMCWGVFSCSYTVLPKEHSLGVIFFLLTFLLLWCNFSSIPCLPVLSTPLSYMYVMYGQVDGLFHWYLWLSDNKGLLLLLLLLFVHAHVD